MHAKLNSKFNNQSGQALLFVIVALTVALTFGISIALRTMTSVSRISRTDTSERVFAAAEGGAEAFLRLSNGQLKSLSDAFKLGTVTESLCDMAGSSVSYDAARGECVVNFPGVAADNISSMSYISVVEYDPSDPETNYRYEFNVEQDTVVEVALPGGSATSLTLCFTPETQADLYYIIHGPNGITKKDGITSITSGGYTIAPGSFDSAGSGNYGYTHCNNVTVPADSDAMRVRSIGSNVKAAVVKSSAPYLPVQGYWILSRGELVQDGAVKVVREVRVFKSLPFLPGIFDFGLFSNTGGWNLP